MPLIQSSGHPQIFVQIILHDYLIDPKDESVTIYQPEQFPEIKSDEEILPVLECVRELQLSAAEMFDWLNIE